MNHHSPSNFASFAPDVDSPSIKVDGNIAVRSDDSKFAVGKEAGRTKQRLCSSRVLCKRSPWLSDRSRNLRSRTHAEADADTACQRHRCTLIKYDFQGDVGGVLLIASLGFNCLIVGQLSYYIPGMHSTGRQPGISPLSFLFDFNTFTIRWVLQQYRSCSVRFRPGHPGNRVTHPRWGLGPGYCRIVIAGEGLILTREGDSQSPARLLF